MENNADPPALMRREQVAEYLGVTPATVTAWTTQGLLPRAKLGHKTVRYRAEDVLEFIDSMIT